MARQAKPKPPPPLELDANQISGLLDRVRAAMSEEDSGLIQAIVSTLLFVAELVAKKNASIRRLRKLLFGIRSEKASAILPKQADADANSDTVAAPKPKPKGHGRNGAKDYPGATRVLVSHPSLKPGDPCPDDCDGKLYLLKDFVRLVRFRGKAALDATVYLLEQLRCALCGKLYTAPAPEGVGEDKYDPSAIAMLAVLRYGTGVPLYRIERMQASLGLPVSSSTQWDLLDEGYGKIYTAIGELIRYGAQGEVVHNDDTPMKVLTLMGKRAHAQPNACPGEDGSKKRAVFTSGIVLIREGRKLVVFFTGPKHAGENLAEVLSHRASELAPPIQMCDALSRNVPKLPKPPKLLTLPKTLETILANCLAHGRRQFVDVVADFPAEVRTVLEILATVYRNDEIAKEQAMSPKERLAFHQRESGPLMDELHAWLLDQRDAKKVEPNSGLGQAIAYMIKHWLKLTLFLRVAGAPLDNNICERALKKAILHRKNSLFYKTTHGAEVGDFFMSVIHTCELNGANSLTYITALLTHSDELRANPADWMPWNYTETLARLTQSPAVTAAAQPARPPTPRSPTGPAPPRSPPDVDKKRPSAIPAAHWHPALAPAPHGLVSAPPVPAP